MRYYYLVCSLPQISFDVKDLPITRDSFELGVYDNLSEEDTVIFNLLKLRIDNVNLIHVLNLGPKHTAEGSLSMDSLLDGIRYRHGLPCYMNAFLARLDRTSQVRPEDLLWEEYIRYVSARNVFLRRYFDFDKNLRNAVNGMILKKYGYSYKEKIVDAGGYVGGMIVSSGADDFGLTQEMPFINHIREIIDRENYLELERFSDMLRFNAIDDLIRFNEFSCDEILGYSLQLDICARWQQLTADRGRGHFDELSQKDVGKQHLYSYVN